MNKKEKIISTIIKLLAVLLSVYGMYKSITGWMSFTYFTILSNIFISIMLAVFLIKDIVNLSGKELKYHNSLYITKFLATISITLTCFVFMLILAPTYETGFIRAYIDNGCGSLCVHLLTPLLAIIDFIFFDYEYNSKKIHSVYSTIPPLCYVVFVIISSNLGLRWGTMKAPYNFLNYGAPTGWFGFDPSLRSWETLGIGVVYMIIILLIIFILLANVFLSIKDKVKSRK